MSTETYGHTPVDKAFANRDVYGIGFDEKRAARRSVRVALIGAGGVAQSKYLPALARLRTIWEPVEIAAVVEPREDHGRKLTATYRTTWFPDVAHMLHSEDVEAAIVLSPDSLHAEHVLACLEGGLHVLVEKPIATSLTDAGAMTRAADAAGRHLMVVANKRFSPPYRRARRHLDEAALGEVASFSGKFNLGYDYVELLEGGTIHLFDLARFLMGDVAAVAAAGVKRFPDMNPGYPIDNATAAIRFASGAVGTLATSASALSLKPWERVEVIGRNAWLEVEDQLELRLYTGEEAATRSWRPVIPNTLMFDEEFGGYLGIVEHFLQVVRGAEAATVTGWDGYRALELLRATQISMLEQGWVPLPLDADAADAAAARWRSLRFA